MSHVIHQPSGRGHHDIGAGFETALLRIHRHAAEDGHGRDRRVVGQADKCVLDLHDQLARRRQDQRAREWLARGIAKRRLLAEQLLQNRQREGEGLARAGLGARDDVAAVERAGNHRALHRPGAFEAEIVQALHQLRMQRQR